MISNNLGKTALLATLLAALSVPAFANVSYNAVTDFPTITASTNPQIAYGVWSYGYATTLSPVNFSFDSTATTDYFGDGGSAAGFYETTSGGGYGQYPLPTVLKNTTGGTIGTEGGTIGPWPANLLLLHPGPSGDYSVVQFTAPTTATYVVTGEFLAIGNFSGVTDDSVSLTSASGSSSTTLYTTTSSTTPYDFTFSQTLTAGESLDFAVGWGPGNQFAYDSTGFDATITATPEPSFYGALALGMSGLLVAIRRRRRA